MERSLAHIEKIEWIKNIEGADAIELCGVLGWQVGGFKVKGQVAWNRGIPQTESACAKMSVSHTGLKQSEETREKKRVAFTGRIFSQEWKDKIKESKTGVPVPEERRERIRMTLKSRPDIICPHCGKVSTSPNNMKRYHFENCKQNPNLDASKILICEHCGFETISAEAMKRWHGDKCGYKK